MMKYFEYPALSLCGNPQANLKLVQLSDRQSNRSKCTGSYRSNICNICLFEIFDYDLLLWFESDINLKII